MALFNYQATDSSGRAIKGTLEARSVPALVDELQSKGFFPVSIKEAASPAQKRQGLPFFNKVSTREVAGLTYALSSLLKAGVQLERAISILGDLERNPALKTILEDVKKGIQGGDTLASRLEKHPAVFTGLYSNTVRAGEASGALEAALERLGRLLEDSERLKDEIRSALMYPCVLAATGVMSLSLMLFYVVPKFAVVLDERATLPLPARLLLFASDTALSYWWAFFLPVFALAVAAYYRFGTAPGRLRLDALKLRSPVIGDIARRAATARFARTLSALLKGGLPVLEAMRIAGGAFGNASMEKEIGPAIEGLKRGKGIAASLAERKVLPDIALHMITVGEETGRLDDLSERLSEMLERDVGSSIKRTVALMEPAIILVMALVIGFMVVSLLLAVLSMNEMPF